jgi:hypothetical protein
MPAQPPIISVASTPPPVAQAGTTVRYNIPGGDLWVTTSTVGGRPTLVVANTGPIIPPEAIGGLFEPFHRLNDRTIDDGFGLGLAIVASIAAMHHGTVTTHPRPEGGLQVVFTMPPSTTPWLDQPFSGPAAPSSATAGWDPPGKHQKTVAGGRVTQRAPNTADRVNRMVTPR